MVTVRRRAFFIDAGYTVRNGKTYISLILKGKKTVRIYYQYDPYFIVEAPLEKKDELMAVRARGRRGEEISPLRVEETEKKVGLEKKRMLKLYCREPSHVPVMRQAVPYPCYEHNIPFTRRFLFDMGLCPLHVMTYEREGRQIKKILKVKEGDPKLSALSFDIETYNPMGAPREGKDPVIMISYCGKKKGVLTTKKSSREFVETVADEKEMLKRFCAIVSEEDPDVIVGYNSANFDLPYLKARAEVVKTPLRLGRYGAGIRELKKGLITGVRLNGRVHFDLYPAAKFFGVIGLIKAQRFTLDEVAGEVLGTKKLKMDKGEIWKLWDSSEIDRLCDYSLVDSELAHALSERLLPLEMEMASVAKMPLFETTLSTSGQLVENLLMYHATGRNELIPSKPGGDEIGERINAPIQGAFVKLPEPGIYENVAVLDFRGLYPSIIVSYNIDPGTLIAESKHGVHDTHGGTEHKAHQGKSDDVFVSPTDASFSKKEMGLIPFVLDYLIDMRMKLKKALKTAKKDTEEYAKLNARSQALKILANSVAGEEPVLVMSPSGKTRIMPIKEFVEPRLGDERLGETRLGDGNGWKAACFVNGRMEYRPIRKVMRHPARKLLRIRTKSGMEVKVTPDHSLFSLNRQCEIVPIRGAELEKGDHLAIPKKIPPSCSNHEVEINIIKELACLPDADTEDFILTTKLEEPLDVLKNQRVLLDAIEDEGIENCAATVAGRTGLGYKTVINNMTKLADAGFATATRDRCRWCFAQNKSSQEFVKYEKLVLSKLKYDPNTRMHVVQFNEVKMNINRVEDSFLRHFAVGAWNGTKLPCMLRITGKIARFLGYFVSEGHSRKQRNQRGGMSYTVALTNYNQAILEDMENCAQTFGVNVTRGKHVVQLNAHIIYSLVKHIFAAGDGAYEKDVPHVIFDADPAIKREFLKAYFLGDGNYEAHSKRYRFTTVSRKLANSLVALIRQLGISSVSIKRDSKFYRIVVFDDLFGHAHRTRNRHPSLHLPGKYIEKEIRELKNIKYYYACKKRIGRDKLAGFYSEYMRKIGKSEKIEKLLGFAESDLYLDEVTHIEAIDSEEPVYDLSVEEAENFIGGFGLLCLHNSFYGYMGYARSRWYSRPCAESVTAWGRKHIAETIEKGEKAGFPVLYADTDSVFLLYKNRDDVIKFMNSVNAALPPKMELELEGFYPRGVFVSKKGSEERGAKKKYALLGEDGRIKIRGFELVRRDWSMIAKETQLKVLEAILKEGSKEKAVKIIRDVVAMLQEGKVPLEMLAISTQLNKDPGSYEVASPELSAAKKMLKAGIPAEKGTVISYVVSRNGKSISEKAEPLELAKDYDADYYINNQVLPAVMKIMKELGYDEYSMKFGGKQKSLEHFFG
ncbi:hypothetical protein H0O00_01170 [Candidatus Micrarchaeota archaeon]|nr:hypothetical protein [Candidatus Micrarchaeota archaeon]